MNNQPNRQARSLTIARWAFLICALFFLGASTWNSREILGETIANNDFRYLSLALPFYLLCHFIAPVFAFLTLKSTNKPVTYRQALVLHIRYLPARYIPGGIWHTVGRIQGLHKLGVSPRALSSLVVMEHLVSLGVALAIGGSIVGFYQGKELAGRFAFVASGVSVLILVLLPFVQKRFFFKTHFGPTIRLYLLSVTAVLAFWSCMATAFVLFLSAFPGAFYADRFVEVAGSYLFAWGLGFLAVFAPQGLGVFEAIAATLVPSALTFTALVSLFAGFRVFVMVGDGASWLAWAAIAVIGRASDTHPVRR